MEIPKKMEFLILTKLKKILSKASITDIEKIIFQEINLKEEEVNYGVCSFSWTRENEVLIYHCEDCSLQPNSCYCSECFDELKHENHNIRVSVGSSYGMCDCGNPLMLKSSSFCNKHPGPLITEQLSKERKKHLKKTFKILIKLIKKKEASESPELINLIIIIFKKGGGSISRILSKVLLKNSLKLLLFPTGTKNFKEKIKSLIYQALIYPEFKENFSIKYIENYSQIIKENVITEFSTQIFSLPSIVLKFVKENNLLDILIKTISSFFETKSLRNGSLDMMTISRARLLPFIEDLSIIFNPEVCDLLINSSPGLFRKLIKMIKHLHNMSTLNRKNSISLIEQLLNDRIFFDSFFIESKFLEIMWRISQKINFLNIEKCKGILEIIFQNIYEILIKEDNEFKKHIWLTPKKCIIYPYDVNSNPISFHIPLHRFCGMIFHKLNSHEEKLEKSINEILENTTAKNAFLLIIEHVIRLHSTIAQIESGIWASHSLLVDHHAAIQASPILTPFSIDMDISFLQAAVLIIPPETILLSIIDKFQLLNFFSLNTEVEQNFTSTPTSFFRLIKMIIKEEGNFNIKREIIHQLILSDLSHSEICKLITKIWYNKIDETLEEIAYFNGSVFTLKNEYWLDYDDHFPHYTMNEWQSANSRFHNKFNNNPPPPKPPIKKFLNLINNTLFHRLLYIVIYKANFELDSISSTTLFMVLDYIYLILKIDKQDEEDFFEKEFEKVEEKVEEFEIFPKDLLFPLKSLKENLIFPIKTPKGKFSLFQLISKLSKIQPYLSKLLNIDEEINNIEEQQQQFKEKSRKRKEEIMKKFKLKQLKFIENHSFEKVEKVEILEEQDDGDIFSIWEASGLKYSEIVPRLSCSLCKLRGGNLGITSYIQLINNLLFDNKLFFNEKLKEGMEILESKILRKLALVTVKRRLLAQSCGHIFHLDCYQKYIDTLQKRALSGDNPEYISIEKNEFTCPVDRQIENCYIPIINIEDTLPEEDKEFPLTFIECLKLIEKVNIKEIPINDIRIELEAAISLISFVETGDSSIGGYESILRVLTMTLISLEFSNRQFNININPTSQFLLKSLWNSASILIHENNPMGIKMMIIDNFVNPNESIDIFYNTISLICVLGKKYFLPSMRVILPLYYHIDNEDTNYFNRFITLFHDIIIKENNPITDLTSLSTSSFDLIEKIGIDKSLASDTISRLLTIDIVLMSLPEPEIPLDFHELWKRGSTVICAITGIPLEISELQEHSIVVGGLSLYIVVRGKIASSLITIQNNVGGIILGSFYKDKWGETDIGFRRGKKLTLDIEMYKKMRQKLINGDLIHEITKVRRDLPRQRIIF